MHAPACPLRQLIQNLVTLGARPVLRLMNTDPLTGEAQSTWDVMASLAGAFPVRFIPAFDIKGGTTPEVATSMTSNAVQTLGLTAIYAIEVRWSPA